MRMITRIPIFDFPYDPETLARQVIQHSQLRTTETDTPGPRAIDVPGWFKGIAHSSLYLSTLAAFAPKLVLGDFFDRVSEDIATFLKNPVMMADSVAGSEISIVGKKGTEWHREAEICAAVSVIGLRSPKKGGELLCRNHSGIMGYLPTTGEMLLISGSLPHAFIGCFPLGVYLIYRWKIAGEGTP